MLPSKYAFFLFLSAIAQPVKSIGLGVILRSITLSSPKSGPSGFTSAAIMRTLLSPLSDPSHISEIRWPVVSSVWKHWDWKAKKMATHLSSSGKWIMSPPSWKTPLSAFHISALPWFIWISWMPFPGVKPKYLSRLGSGPHFSPKTYTALSSIAIALAMYLWINSFKSLSGPGISWGKGFIMVVSKQFPRI